MCSNTSDPVLIYHDVLDPKLRLIHNPKMQTDRTHQHRERPFPKKSKNLFPRPIDFGRFATFPLKKVFFVNQILSGLGEFGITGVLNGLRKGPSVEHSRF